MNTTEVNYTPTCPVCKFTPQGGIIVGNSPQRTPAPGYPAVCPNCGSAGIITLDMSVVQMTADQFMDLPEPAQEFVYKMTRTIKGMNRNQTSDLARMTPVGHA